MSRHATFGVAVSLVLALLALGSPAAGGGEGNKGKKVVGKEPSNVARVRHMLALLDETFDTKDFQAPLTLKETLGLLIEKVKDAGKELVILVNEQAFRDEAPEAPNIYDTQVKFPPFPRRMTVSNALRLALSRVPTGNATYLVRAGYLEITTQEQASLKKLLQQRVVAAFDRRPVGEVLDELSARTGVSVTVDVRLGEKLKQSVTAAFGNDVTLEAALRMVADMADMRVVVLEEGVYVTSVANARELERERRPKQGEDGNPPAGRPRPLRGEKKEPAP